MTLETEKTAFNLKVAEFENCKIDFEKTKNETLKYLDLKRKEIDDAEISLSKRQLKQKEKEDEISLMKGELANKIKDVEAYKDSLKNELDVQKGMRVKIEEEKEELNGRIEFLEKELKQYVTAPKKERGKK